MTRNQLLTLRDQLTQEARIRDEMAQGTKYIMRRKFFMGKADGLRMAAKLAERAANQKSLRKAVSA